MPLGFFSLAAPASAVGRPVFIGDDFDLCGSGWAREPKPPYQLVAGANGLETE